MLWPAPLSADVLKLALPPPLSVFVPSTVAPSLNVTVPVGVPRAGTFAVTVTVKLTAWPEVDGLSDELTAVVVPPALTGWLMAAEGTALKFGSPLYVALMLCGPAPNAAVLNVACPVPFKFTVPSAVAPSLNVTLPVGTPAELGTAPLNVTFWP